MHVETCTTAFPYMPSGDDENINVGGGRRAALGEVHLLLQFGRRIV